MHIPDGEPMRLIHVDAQLTHLSRRPRTENVMVALDFWLDKRLDMTRPYRQTSTRTIER